MRGRRRTKTYVDALVGALGQSRRGRGFEIRPGDAGGGRHLGVAEDFLAAHAHRPRLSGGAGRRLRRPRARMPTSRGSRRTSPSSGGSPPTPRTSCGRRWRSRRPCSAWLARTRPATAASWERLTSSPPAPSTSPRRYCCSAAPTSAPYPGTGRPVPHRRKRPRRPCSLSRRGAASPSGRRGSSPYWIGKVGRAAEPAAEVWRLARVRAGSAPAVRLAGLAGRPRAAATWILKLSGRGPRPRSSCRTVAGYRLASSSSTRRLGTDAPPTQQTYGAAPVVGTAPVCSGQSPWGRAHRPSAQRGTPVSRHGRSDWVCRGWTGRPANRARLNRTIQARRRSPSANHGRTLGPLDHCSTTFICWYEHWPLSFAGALAAAGTRTMAGCAVHAVLDCQWSSCACS